MAQFWRLENTMVEGGDWFYLDPNEIIGVDFGDTDFEAQTYTLIIRGGKALQLSDADGRKLMKWAESQAEPIPERETTMGWRQG